MSRRLNRMWLLPVLLLAGETWALGLGDIRLSSALNEPLRAQIELLSVAPEDIASLEIQLATAETFARYGLDRPNFLSSLRFAVQRGDGTDDSVVAVTSLGPITEPFITFLVEVSWSRGRLLREYTLLLDPPTFAPPPVARSSRAVTAPSRASETDRGRIERPPPPPQPAAAQPVAPPPSAARRPAPANTASAEPQQAAAFDTTPGDQYRVERGETLWAIAHRVAPDSRLTVNQTMLAIFEANPEAFADNINIMSAGALLNIPSADNIIRITRADAMAEVRRQNEAWGGPVGIRRPQPSLVLVPPDDQQSDYEGGMTAGAGAAAGADAATRRRIEELQQTISNQDSLLEIRDNELAALRAELARLQGEEAAPALTDTSGEEPADDQVAAAAGAGDQPSPFDDETADIVADDGTAPDDTVAGQAGETEPAAVTAPPKVVATRPAGPGLVAAVIEFLSGFWGILIGGLVIVLGLLVWFSRRAGREPEEESTGVWDALDADDLDQESLASTERLRALAQDDETAIVVVEEAGAATSSDLDVDGTLEVPAATEAEVDPLADAGSVEAPVNVTASEPTITLDQSDPVAEADFHMAYGLYDQAADLINGALVIDPEREDLLAKLCEIYFVWGNRDAFIDAATRMRDKVGGDSANADWDKIVIMGQQIAADHELFSGVIAGAATRAVDLPFEGGMEETGALDIDLAPEAEAGESQVIDLGADDEGFTSTAADDDELSLAFGELDSETSQTEMMPEVPGTDATRDLPVVDETVSTPAIDQPFESLAASGELPDISDDDATVLASPDDYKPTDATAEIELDDLGLDLDGLAETSASGGLGDDEMLSDLDDTTESQTLKIDADLAATDSALPDYDDLAATGKNLTLGEDDADAGLDISMLDATGATQVLSDELAAAATAGDVGAMLGDSEQTMLAPANDDGDDELAEAIDTLVAPVDDDAPAILSGDAATMLAPLDDDDPTTLADDGDFDFAKTESLPDDSFGDDATQDMPGSTDMDLDLDDLTAALKVSEFGSALDQHTDDATVQQPKLTESVDLNVGMDVGEDDLVPTQKISPDDRTMTEVGTKLDLARAYVDMGDPGGARSILEEVLKDGDEGQRQQAQQLLDSLPG